MSAETTGGTGGTRGTTGGTRGNSVPAAAVTSPAASRPTGQVGAGGVLATEHGRTMIADSVVAKIVAMATQEIGGVHEMGAGATRMMGTLRERVPGARASVAQGVRVEVGEVQAAADIDLVVEYGVVIPDLAEAIRRNVINAVERMCGLEVTEVNISIDDIYVPGDEQPAGEPRVQ
jgi:uncharacterized alkaline shock family protein YloU